MNPDGRWHSRGYLPHFDGDDATQHVTFHLADSLPQQVVAEVEEELRFLPAAERDFERWRRLEQWMDAGYGSCVLKEPAVAAMVQGALLYFDAERCRILAWVVMPNHVHVLFTPINGWAVSAIITSWKVYTARHIYAFWRENPDKRPAGYAASQGRPHATRERGVPQTPTPDHVWHREYWDRFMRNQEHFARTRAYIHGNPVKAGLVAYPEEWPWSSAHPANGDFSARMPHEP